MTDFSNVFLISDMDGTLINSKSQISTINKYALNEFTKTGGTFAPSFGSKKIFLLPNVTVT